LPNTPRINCPELEIASLTQDRGLLCPFYEPAPEKQLVPELEILSGGRPPSSHGANWNPTSAFIV
jgi:hypothetical protein